MVEDGKITAAEAMTFIKALEQDAGVAEPEMEVYQAAPGPGRRAERVEVSSRPTRPVRRSQGTRPSLGDAPLWIGVGFTVLFASLMYYSIESSGFGFWFYCLTFPFLLGVFVVAISAGGMNFRWLFVDVHQKPGEKPERITLGFPVPLDWWDGF